MVAMVDFDLPGDVLFSEEIQLLQNFLPDLIGEVLRQNHNEE